MPMNRDQFGQVRVGDSGNLSELLPALRALIKENAKMHPPYGPQIYRQATSRRDIEQITGMTGMGGTVQIDEGAPMRYDDVKQTFPKTFRHAWWGLGFRVTKQMRLFDKWSQVQDMARQLGRSRRDTLEILAAIPFNNAFSGGVHALPDGQPLCSASHPLVKAGGVVSNVASVSADLGVDALQLALTEIRLWRTHSGKRARIDPARIMVAPQAEFDLIETLNIGSDMRPDTAENVTHAINHRIGYRRNLQPVVWDYLTDPDAWFILTDKEDTQAWWFTAESWNVTQDVDFDTRTLKNAGWEGFSYGFADWVGVWGNPGV
jgi:hypothetical protein